MNRNPDIPRQFNVYLEPELTQWLDSMEGVPVCEPSAPPGERFLRFQWQKGLHRWLDRLGASVPGVALAAALTVLGGALAAWMGQSVFGFESSPISPILVTILLGMLVRSVAGLPVAYEHGLRICVKTVLRIGVVLLGLQLSLPAVGRIGLGALPIVAACIAAALGVVSWLSRVVGLSSRLGSLIAVGTSICGVSAIVATAPAIGAEKNEVSYSVAVITFFGITATLVYPFVAHWVFAGNPALAGYFLGTAIHDTSQVAGAGLMYAQWFSAPQALEVAATTKLVRNLCMGAVIPLVAVLHHRRSRADAGGRVHLVKWNQCLPLFVVAFIAMAGVRSAGDLGDLAFGAFDRALWMNWIGAAKTLAVFCLALAMGAVGLGTGFGQLKVLGWRPLGTGLVAALLVGGVSAALILLINPQP
jgi:uncharacterized integral membrane protein (TIGR00698 family)